MGYIRKISSRLHEMTLVSNNSRIKYSQTLGVAIGKKSRLMDLPFWGSEPWLIEIGEHVTVSDHVTFLTHDGGTFVFREEPAYREVIKYGRIIIGDNCFIGSHVILLPNIRIGKGSVVGAGAVVTKSVPDHEVWAGNPAHRICSVEDYAEKCRISNPAYDRKKYAEDKRAELLRILPRPGISEEKQSNSGRDENESD